jgi:hypothetical protein
MKTFSRRIRKIFRGHIAHWSDTPFSEVSRSYLISQTIIKAFYCIILFLAVLEFQNWTGYFSRHNLLPLWPIEWIKWVPQKTGIVAIMAFFYISGVLGAIFYYYRGVRILVFLSLLEYIALKNSFGKIGHSWHLWVIVSFILIFLPSTWNKTRNVLRSSKMKSLVVFWTAQGMILLSYTMAGVGKIVGSIYQTSLGQINAFHPRAMAMHISERLIQTDTASLFGPWLINHYLLGWPMMLGAIYLQFFALWILFRPSIQRWWVAGLILFHVCSYFILTINFPYSCLILALFFLTLPQPNARFSFTSLLKDLPLVGIIFRKLFA